MRIKKFASLLALVLGVAFYSSWALAAQKAYYYPNADRLFWFMIISDTHIGASSTAAQNLAWAVGPARQVIAPQFIVNSGDLTDSTNGGLIPNGPYQEEWTTYRQILESAGMNAAFYYDMPGNHDEYNDGTLAYYRANSIQGRATGQTQPSWTRQFSYGSYHFLGVCTPGNDGAPWSPWKWDNFGDHAGLDNIELPYIDSDLASHTEAQLTLIFGHHPFEADYYDWTDTGIQYGLGTFLSLINKYLVPFYGFGHTHNYRENFYSKNLTNGIYYMNVASLGKSDQNQYAVIAIDGNGLSIVPAQIGVWPVVMITAPVDYSLGTSPNPYSYEIPKKSNNPIRALVFDPNPVSQVQFSIDGSPVWQDMQRREGTPIWEGHWNANTAAAGAHIIAVRAQGSTLVTDSITTVINAALPRAIISPIIEMLLCD
ncbi:MAG: hypothetical protein ACYDIC_01660 [Desulfobaccales bacterium]